MTKRRLDGSTFMEMYFVIQSTNLYLLQPLVLALSCLHCKDLFECELLNHWLFFFSRILLTSIQLS